MEEDRKHAPRHTPVLRASDSADLRYWRNGTYYIVTDQPWALPATKVMFTGGARDDEHGKPGNVEILSVRMDAISKHVDERNQLGTTISPAAAVVFTEAAEDLPSPMVSSATPPAPLIEKTPSRAQGHRR